MAVPVIVSTGSVPCGKHPGRLALDLEVDVIREACEGARIRPRDLEALVIVPPGYRLGFSQIRAQRVAERLGCWPRSAVEVDIGGLSSLYALHVAAVGIEAGRGGVGAGGGGRA